MSNVPADLRYTKEHEWVRESSAGSFQIGITDFAQGALGRPVRIGRPLALKGLPEAHATPGFSTLAGLVLYVASRPLDIRDIGRHGGGGGGAQGRQAADGSGLGLVGRVLRALRDYF